MSFRVWRWVIGTLKADKMEQAIGRPIACHDIRDVLNRAKYQRSLFDGVALFI